MAQPNWLNYHDILLLMSLKEEIISLCAINICFTCIFFSKVQKTKIMMAKSI